MIATRRGFLAALASLPFLGRFLPKKEFVITAIDFGTRCVTIGQRITFYDAKTGALNRLPLNAVHYDGPEVFYKGLSLTERMKWAKAAAYDQGDQWPER